MSSHNTLSAEKQRLVLAEYDRLGSFGAVERATGIRRRTVSRYVRAARGDAAERRDDDGPVPELVAEMLRERAARCQATPASTTNGRVEAVDDGLDAMASVLKRTPLTIEEIAERAKTTRERVSAWVAEQQARGLNLHCFGGRFSVEKTMPSGHILGATLEYVSRPDNTFVFGACGDQHLCSKYERIDVAERLYDRYADEGVDRVFNTGNWIDGEARFNKHDLKVHGMDAQLAYLAEHYPRRPGLHTYAVAGDDHEGWYGQREGVDIGRYAEHVMRDAGRDDWHDLGYMEAHLRLVNANTGASSVLSVVHPGGGSAYALSYSIQKIVESYDGGEKPAVGLYGHYHKLWAGNIRNVWTCQTGCCQDQTPFMRKKRLEAHVGAFLVKLRQDPETGAIVEMTPTMLRYFNRGYYNDRWSHAREVVLPERR